MVTRLPFLALYLSVQQVIFITDISEHLVVYLSLRLFDEVAQFNYSHFSVVEVRNRELNDLPKIVQEVCGRERLCPGAFLQDTIKAWLQRRDILIHKTTASALGCSFTSAALASGQRNLWRVSVNLLFLGKRKKTHRKEAEAEISLKPEELDGKESEAPDEFISSLCKQCRKACKIYPVCAHICPCVRACTRTLRFCSCIRSV